MERPCIPDVYVKLAELLYGATDVTKLERDCAKAVVRQLLRERPSEYEAWVLAEYPKTLEAPLVGKLVRSIANGWVSEAGWRMDHGIWDHFKGGIYLSERVDRCADTGEPRVSYLSMVNGTPHSRRARQWNELVEWPDGEWRSRFVYRGPDLETPAPVFKVVAK